MIIVNFKTYEEAQAEKAVKLAQLCEKVAHRTNAQIAVVPSLIDLATVKSAVNIPVFSQHVDSAESGKHTGHITASALKAHNITGTLINHSERQVPINHIQKAVQLCKENNILSIVCAPSLDIVNNVLEVCAPDYIAYETPELIGGEISVTTANPDIIKKAVELVKEKNNKVKVLCGAGVKNGKDMNIALELGCTGVLVATGVVKVDDPEKALIDLANV